MTADTPTPAPMPATSYCAAGMADAALANHEESLQTLHNRGQLQLLDRGEDSNWRRWRMQWTEGTRTIRCGLLVGKDTNVAGLDDTLLFWLYAESSNKPFGFRDQQNPSWRIGLDALDAEHNIRDTLGQYSLTQYGAFFSPETGDLAMPARIIEGAMRTTPLVVINAERDEAPKIRAFTERFRKATRGLCGVFVVDAGVRAELNKLLPAKRPIPARGARLFLPYSWLPHLEEPTIRADRLDRPGRWRALTDTVLNVSSWRTGQFAINAAQWRSILHDAMDDQPLHPAHGLTWQTPDNGTTAELVTQLQRAQQHHEALRETAGERSEHIATATLQLQQHASMLDQAQRSRQRLARLAARLRAERDALETALHPGGLPELLADTVEHETDAQLHADELDRIDDETHHLRHEINRLTQQHNPPPAPADAPSEPQLRNFSTLLATARRSFTGLAFGPRTDTATTLDGHPRTASWLRRTWAILQLLDEYANHQNHTRGLPEYLAQHGPRFGLSPTLLATGETRQVTNNQKYRQARTFPVPADLSDTGRAYFPAHFRIERGGGFAPRLHFHDDHDGTTGRVHIGYIGPHLPSPGTN